MRWLALLAVCVLVPCARPAQSKDDESPLWHRCYDAIDWFVNAEVPDTEKTMFDMVMNRKLQAFSETWVRKAIEDADGLGPALAKARKESKLVLWYVPHIEGQHMILPHLLDRYMMVGPLSHPDVTGVANRHFVCVKLPAGGTLGKRYGLVAPDAIEPAILLLDANGKVHDRLVRMSNFDPAYLRRFLVASVAQNESSRGAVTPKTVERLMHEGNDADALGALQSLPGQSVARARLAVVLARKRAELPLDLPPQVEPLLLSEDAGALRLAWATLLLRQGKAAAAWPLLNRDGDADPERGFHRGVAQYLLRDEKRARAIWARVAKQHRASIWGARADAYARDGTDGAHGEGPLTRGMLHLQHHDPRKVSDPWWRTTRRRGVHFLLQAQRSDGSWEGARWGGRDEKKQPGYHNIKTAISALCCAALHATRPSAQAQSVDEALVCGERFLLRDGLVERGEAIVWTYAHAFRLLHFSRRLSELEPRHQKRVHRKMSIWIRHLVEHQRQNKGSFRHYTYRSTFVTACVTYCLWFAKEAGLDVPASVFDEAAKALEGAHGGPRGLYGYLLDHPAATRSIRGASGRQPLCEWTLFLLGKRKPEALAKALEIFEEGYAHLEQARKANFHIPALDNTAGYYFFHDFYPACEAARVAAGGSRATKSLSSLLSKLRHLQEPDGTFLDCGFSYGKCYSTAMALLSLDALTRP